MPLGVSRQLDAAAREFVAAVEPLDDGRFVTALQFDELDRAWRLWADLSIPADWFEFEQAFADWSQGELALLYDRIWLAAEVLAAVGHWRAFARDPRWN